MNSEPEHELSYADQLALIRDREPFTRQLLGLPRRGQLHADAVPDAAGFVRREGRVETFDQALCDAQLLAQQRPAAGFGRMRREHRLDGQTADELEDLRRGEALALQRGDRILHAAGLGPLTVLEQIFAAAPDAVDPFRQIDALEPGGEGAHHFARQRRRALAYTSRELGARLARAGAAADGGDAVQLHQLEQLLPALLAQDFAHERAERMHVLAQRLVLGRKVDVAAVHPSILTGRCAVGRAPSSGQQHRLGALQLFRLTVDHDDVPVAQHHVAGGVAPENP